jgi:pyruvate dehydrogenase E2 component (dihydrolipoamide acetyltransferase)
MVALENPDRAASLILIASTGLGLEIDEDYLTGFIQAERRKDLQAVVSRLFANPALITRDLVENLLKFKRLDGVTAALTAIKNVTAANGRQLVSLFPRLRAIQIPTQIIWGGADRIIPVTHARALSQTFTTHVFEDGGHMVHLERARDVNAIICG